MRSPCLLQITLVMANPYSWVERGPTSKLYLADSYIKEDELDVRVLDHVLKQRNRHHVLSNK